MSKLLKRLTKLICYIVSLSTPAALAAAVNEAATVDELDDAVLSKAGVRYGRS